MVLLDPVTFLLCDPAIASNFLHRVPRTVLELLMHFFVSRELFIAHTLSRHFSWSHNALFVEDLPGARCPSSSSSSASPAKRTTAGQRNRGSSSLSSSSPYSSSPGAQPPQPPPLVVLSSDDAIVPSDATRSYLTSGDPADPPAVELVWLEGMQHGQMMLQPAWLQHLKEKIRERCGLASSSMSRKIR